MAITSLEIIYQPERNNFKIVPIGNDINIIVRAKYTDLEPDFIHVLVTIEGVVIDNFRPMKYNKGIDNGYHYIDFIFFTSEIVKPFMGGLDDEPININEKTLWSPKNVKVNLRFYDVLNMDKSVYTTINYRQGVRQLNQPLIDYDGFLGVRKYIAPRNFYTYVYYIPLQPSYSQYWIDGIKGLIADRYKQIKGVILTDKYKNHDKWDIWLDPIGVYKEIYLTDFDYKCDLLIKYLDQNGEYRFWVFNKFFEVQDNSKNLGFVNNFYATSENATAENLSLGQSTIRTYNAFTNVPEIWLNEFSDIYTSPRIYLLRYNGETMQDNTDFDSCGSWLQVTAKTEGIRKKRKGGNLNANITFTLPEISNITML